MWKINSLWFDISIVMTIVGFGSILFGHFEEHKPKWRRVLKVMIILAVILTLSATVGRIWSFGLLGLMFLIVLYLHAWWLPKNGVNGWTGEPKDKLYELIGYKKK